MISLNDESIVSVIKSSVAKFSYVETFKDNIYYTNQFTKTVTCCDFQGNTRWVFSNASVLVGPFGISVDGDGNVYVVGNRTNNVVIISPNGQHYKELLISENGLNEPMAVSCNIFREWDDDRQSLVDKISEKSRSKLSYAGNSVNPSMQEAGKKHASKLTELASPSDKQSKVKNDRGADDLETQSSSTPTGVHYECSM
ncbi:unnamed protein product [Mytilus edulis]|uniref:Uncharacterized protein n=1 Tax=Mytilus edulis TaxID=6550 RepID=A0A8S3R0N2_MYTED|nr:unnamed protein product [Mytilus edulis]